MIYCEDASFDPVYIYIYTGADGNCTSDLGYDLPDFLHKGASFYTYHTKEVTRAVDITERQWNYAFNGERIAVMAYHDPLTADHRTNVLKTHEIYTTSIHPSNLKRSSETVLSANEKSVSTYRTQLNSAGDWAEVDCIYDAYGNVTRVTYPENATGQRASNKYTYDNTQHQFVEGISNQFVGESICNSYDYATGLLLRQVGINGHAMQ